MADSARCLKTKETSPLEPDALENKFYCLGIGNVLTVDVPRRKYVGETRVINRSQDALRPALKDD